MKIDYDKLRKVIELHAVPRWENKDDEWPFRKGGGERYQHEKVLKNASPLLKEDALRIDAKQSLLDALKFNMNLLSQFETMFAKIFIKNTPENVLKEKIISFVHGHEKLEVRLRSFLDWSKVKPVPGENKKSGFSPQVASYFLAVSNPHQYPYCKPVAYNSAVIELIGKEYKENDPIKRMLHCAEFYKSTLNFLEKEYGLEEGNLFDVHSLFYVFHHDSWLFPANGGKTEAPIESTLYQHLVGKHNVVLYGPPGTGKTRDALLFADKWRGSFGNDAVFQITFHPSYCYEDFIEGFRPTPDGTGFHLKDGIFKVVCNKAKANLNTKYLLIVDEINRGDIARILGELITILEGDKRGPNYATILQQSGESFYVPENLYVLGTMNTADKSISLMDLAIRRRFLFIPCYADPDIFNEDKNFYAEVDGIRLSNLLIGINQKLIEAGVDRDRILGHSYLLISKQDQFPLETLINRMRYEIIPLIEEYCYSDRTLMKNMLSDLVSESGEVDSDIIEDPERFIETLKKIEIE